MSDWRNVSRRKARATQVRIARQRWNLENRENLQEERENRNYTPFQR